MEAGVVEESTKEPKDGVEDAPKRGGKGYWTKAQLMQALQQKQETEQQNVASNPDGDIISLLNARDENL